MLEWICYSLSLYYINQIKIIQFHESSRCNWWISTQKIYYNKINYGLIEMKRENLLIKSIFKLADLIMIWLQSLTAMHR